MSGMEERAAALPILPGMRCGSDAPEEPEQEAGHEATKKAWYHSGLGSIDLARQMGLTAEERREQPYKEFRKQLKPEE